MEVVAVHPDQGVMSRDKRWPRLRQSSGVVIVRRLKHSAVGARRIVGAKISRLLSARESAPVADAHQA